MEIPNTDNGIATMRSYEEEKQYVNMEAASIETTPVIEFIKGATPFTSKAVPNYEIPSTQNMSTSMETKQETSTIEPLNIIEATPVNSTTEDTLVLKIPYSMLNISSHKCTSHETQLEENHNLVQRGHLVECRSDSFPITQKTSMKKNRQILKEGQLQTKDIKANLSLQKRSVISKCGSSKAFMNKRNKDHDSLKCMICGDAVTGHIHYGGRSCQSCRAFFRRSAQKLYR